MRVRVAGGEARAQWAAAHHDPTARPTPGIPADICQLLAKSDGERVI